MPLQLVNQLATALDQTNRMDLVQQVMGINAALLHALDCGFGKGKGKILDKWIKSMSKDLFKEDTANKSPERAKADSFNALSSMFPTMTHGKRKKRGNDGH
jgi:hypothetical protein